MTTKATNFKFDEKTNDLLNTLKEDSDASTKSEVIRMALKLFNVVNTAKNDNQKLILKDKNGRETEIIF